MKSKLQYCENLMGREFYDFYRKTRRKPSKVIDQYNYFEKAIYGMCFEIGEMLNETDHGGHLKGIGVFHKHPFGEVFQNINLFTKKKKYRKALRFYLEDSYLRNLYLTTNTRSDKALENKKSEDKSGAIILHRKLKLKK